MKLQIVSVIDTKDLALQLSHEITDEQKVKLALDFGDGGDLTYELRLLQELTKLIPKIYPLKSISKDDELYPVVTSLLKLKEQLKFLDNE